MGIHSLSFVSWNTRGLIGRPGADTKLKHKTHIKLLKTNDIVIIQEGHGSSEAWERLKCELTNSHFVAYSCMDSHAKGGLGFFIKKHLCDLTVKEPELVEHVQGRAATLILRFQVGNIFVNNVHVENFDVQTSRKVIDILARNSHLASKDPSARSVSLTGGDFNFRVNDEQPNRISLDHSITIPKTKDNNHHRAQQNKWHKFLECNTELHQPEHTRLGHAENGDGDEYLFSSRIDRLYTSWAPWQIIHLNIRTNTHVDLAKVESTCDSDHAPVGSKITPKSHTPKSQRPIPRWLAQHPAFKNTLNELLANYDDTKTDDPYEAAKHIKTIFRKASQLAIKRIYSKTNLNNEELFQVVLQAARCIHQNGFRVARHVKKDLPELGQHLDLSGDNVELIDPESFHRKTIVIARQYYEKEQENIHTSLKPKGGRMAQINRHLQLWSPFQRKAVNVGIIRMDGSVATDPQNKAIELRNYWGKTFERKKINRKLVQIFADNFCPPIDFSNTHLPTERDIMEFLKRTKHSAPGPDGIPYSCWLAAGEQGARILHRILVSMCNGKSPPVGFNDMLGIYLPKGSLDGDTKHSVNRTGDCTRPLGLKNTDNKSVAGAVNYTISPTIAKAADTSQNGFTKGRQGVDNVVTLDAQARIQDHIAGAKDHLPISQIPIMPLYDFAAAFPSIAHEFMFVVFAALRLPIGLLLFLEALYSNNRCFGCFDGIAVFLYDILSGIIQGCPASGSVFVLSVDGFLRLLNSLDPDTVNRAFADDIGSVIPALYHLPKYYRAFNLFEKISGLALKPKKCAIIPLGRAFTENLAKEITEYLKTHAPGWAAFAIRTASEYLGFIIGPGGGNDASWEKAFKNFTSTADEIGKARLAPSIGTDLYSIKAFPRLSYIPQLCTPPKKTHQIETHAIEVILHIPHNTLPRNVPYCCDQIGMRKFTPVTLMSEATLIRTSLKTCTAWQDQYEQLEGVRKEYGPIGILAASPKIKHGHRDSERWTSCAFVDNLYNASKTPITISSNTVKSKRFSLQAEIQKQIGHKHFQNNFAEAIHKRLYKFIAVLAIDSPTLIRLAHNTANAVKKLPPSIGFAVTKTWANGWVTDSRVGASNVSPCRLGCDPEDPNHEDRLNHYLDCKWLWNCIHTKYQHITNIRLEHSRFNALCIIPPWTSTDPDPRDIQDHAFCLYVACDVFQTHSNTQKTSSGKAHSKKTADTDRISDERIANHVEESFRRLMRFTKLPNKHPTANKTQYRTKSDQPGDFESSPKAGAGCNGLKDSV